jgi:CHAT domain-containing protein/tetratricopeptide (TPR) repeat protein
MNANRPTICRWGGLLVLALVALGAGGRVQAQTRGFPPSDALGRADELYRADRLPQAEALYRESLATAGGADRRRCFDRLLAIYVRVGRLDQAVQTGLTYSNWLRQAGDPVRARELALDLGRWYLALGHYAQAEPHLRQALAEIDAAPLPPAREVAALTYLALAAEKQGHRTRAEQAWANVEVCAGARLDDPRRELDLPVRIECVRRLADSYRFQGRPEKAVPRLEQVLPAFDALKEPDPVGRRDTLRQLAGHLVALDRQADAEKRLKEALALHRRHAASDRLTRAELSGELADAVERQGRLTEAEGLRHEAEKDYQAAMQDSRAGRLEVAGALDAFWKLQLLYQRTGQYGRALRLTQDQAEQWAGGLVEPRLHAEQGTLQVRLGDYAAARRLLEGAVNDLEGQKPVNLVALPVAQLSLAIAELATGDRPRAEERGRRCRALYQAHSLPEDRVLVETYNLLGTCAALGGDYVGAIRHYRAGVDLCGRLGRTAEPARCNLLLNLALLHKAQGDLEQALPVCQDARASYQGFAGTDALGSAAFDAATAALLAAQGRLKEASELAVSIQDWCRRHEVSRGPLMIAAYHCQALFHLSQRQLDQADSAWREVGKLHGPQSPLRPRTLNWLALTRECQGRPGEAEKLYREALELHRKNPRPFPVTYYTTLWRLANVIDRRDRAESRQLLDEAVAVVEKARLRTYGDAGQRARFFAQFAPAFDDLTACGVRDGEVPAAVVATARGRSRTLLDQLLLAGADPFQGLPEPERESLRQQEEKLRQAVAARRASALMISPEALGDEESRQLLADVDEAQRQYADFYGKMLDASLVHHSLSDQGFNAAKLDELRRTLGPKKLLLVYHVGRHRSHLFLLGDHAEQAFELTVPPAVQRWAAQRRARPSPERQRQEPSAPRTQAGAVPLGEDTLRALVENYLEQIIEPSFQPTRGMRLKPQAADLPATAPGPEVLAEVVLPPDARKRIRSLSPGCVVVVPDGALHKLPFEALLLHADEQPTYVLDELPPLAYAPSVAILALVAGRQPAAPDGLRSLLTVTPDYTRGVRSAVPAGPADSVGPGRPGAPDQALSRLWGQLPPLKYAEEESQHVIGLFDSENVKQLRGARVTKKLLAEAVRNRHVVHIAAHGFADERFDNRFGALVLTPPSDKEPPDKGFLTLDEIYALPLDGCELAVLSACQTNVGPQPPLEAGVSLAGGFLAAGARRVVGSHWGVDDRSTAALMAAFFEGVMTSAPRGESVSYARALQQARLRLRKSAKWSAPYHWAPFVLVGPGD